MGSAMLNLHVLSMIYSDDHWSGCLEASVEGVCGEGSLKNYNFSMIFFMKKTKIKVRASL